MAKGGSRHEGHAHALHAAARLRPHIITPAANHRAIASTRGEATLTANTQLAPRLLAAPAPHTIAKATPTSPDATILRGCTKQRKWRRRPAVGGQTERRRDRSAILARKAERNAREVIAPGLSRPPAACPKWRVLCSLHSSTFAFRKQFVPGAACSRWILLLLVERQPTA